MGARAENVDETRRRVIAAALRLFSTRAFDEVSLRAVADESGVGLATVVRHFGSKQRLFVAAIEVGEADVERLADTAPPGDVRGAIRAIVADYEKWGPTILHLLAQERRVPAIRRVTDHGRAYHRAWVERTLAPLLRGRSGATSRVRLAVLMAVTDVHTWRLLRQELGLSRAETERAIRELLEAVGGR